MSAAYSARSWPERLHIMQTLEAAGCAMHEGHIGSGFVAAIGRNRLGAAIAALEPLGFQCGQVYLFPLGTDKPADHLRHDSHGIPAANWLLAHFEAAP